MSAFQSYAGAYDFDGGEFAWRCYSTARVYEVRLGDHAPLPNAPAGQKWVLAERTRNAPDVVCLVDETVSEFSQILLQVEAMPRLGSPVLQALASA